jgi:hypothetical protein
MNITEKNSTVVYRLLFMIAFTWNEYAILKKLPYENTVYLELEINEITDNQMVYIVKM